MSIVRSPVRSVVRSPVRGVFGGADTQTDLQRLLALSPSLVIWPANGAGWQGTSGGTLAASGQPLGLGADLSQLQGKTLGEWLATAPELVPSGQFDSSTGWTLASGMTVSGGALTIATAGYSEARFDAAAINVGANKVLVVTFTVSSYASGIPSVGIDGGSAVTVSTGNGVKTAIVRAGATGLGRVVFILGAAGMVISGVSIRELPGNHLRAGTWASPSDAARANYVIQTDPALYNVSGQPELVTNGDFSDGTTGWTSIGTFTVSDGQATVAGVNGPDPSARSTSFAVTTGKYYVISGTIITAGGSPANNIFLRISSVAGFTDARGITVSSTATGTFRAIIQAPASWSGNATVVVQRGGNPVPPETTVVFDNISVKEIPAAQYKYALSFSGVDDYYSLLNAISITESMTVVSAFKRASAGIQNCVIGNSAASVPYAGRWQADNFRLAALGATESGYTVGSSTATGSFVETIARSASTDVMRYNGTQIGTRTPPTVSGELNAVGRRNANYNSGEISFLAVFPTELTGADLALVEQIAAATNGAVLA
jgi:hypothetical protein